MHRRYKFALIGILTFIFLFWILIAKDNYFHWDEWQFFSIFDQKPSSFLLAPYGEHFLPLNLLNHFVLFKLFGLTYFPFHLSVVLIHLINSFLLFKIVVMETKNEKIALFSILIFGISSVYLDNLVWSQGISNVGSALFISIAFYSFLNYVKKRRIIWLALSVVSLTISPLFNAFGLLAAFSFCIITFLLNRLNKNKLKVSIAYFLTGILNLFILIHFSGSSAAKALPEVSLTTAYKVLEFTGFGVIRGTIVRFLYPGLHILRDGQQIKVIFFIALTIVIVLLIIRVFYAWLKDKKTRRERVNKIIIYFSLISVGYLAASIGRISYGLGQAGIPRYTYQAFFFLVVLGAIVVNDFRDKRRVVAASLILIWIVNLYSIFQLEYGFWKIMMNRDRQFISEASYLFSKNKVIYDFEPKGISPKLRLSDYWYLQPKDRSIMFISSDKFDSGSCKYCMDEKTRLIYVKLSSEYQRKFD